MSNFLLLLQLGASSVNYDPDQGIAIFPNIEVYHQQSHTVPLDYQKAILDDEGLEKARGGLTGRKHVLLMDNGDTKWRQKAEEIVLSVNGTIVPPPSGLLLTRGDSVVLRPVDWIWNNWLAKGKLHMMAGVAGTGKTTIAISLAAVITNGGILPDGSTTDAGNVILWSGEDGFEDTLAPRLKAAGANMQRIHFIAGVECREGKRAFDPATDMVLLHEAICRINPVLLIVDPIVNVVMGNDHKNAETRRALQPLVDLAVETGVAVLGISHFSKGTSGRDPLERVTGSLAFGALPRVVMVTAKREGNTRVLCRAKNNLGVDKGGFRYTLETLEQVSGIITSRVVWGEAIDQSAHQILSEFEVEGNDAGSELEEAKEFLQSEVSQPKSAKQIFAAAKEAGISETTLRRAKKSLGIVAQKSGMTDGWVWQMP